jgi:hypothetical protein
MISKTGPTIRAMARGGVSANVIAKTVRKICFEQEQKNTKILDSVSEYSERIQVHLSELEEMRQEMLKFTSEVRTSSLCKVVKAASRVGYDVRSFIEHRLVECDTFTQYGSRGPVVEDSVVEELGGQLATALTLGSRHLPPDVVPEVTALLNMREVSSRLLVDGHRSLTTGGAARVVCSDLVRTCIQETFLEMFPNKTLRRSVTTKKSQCSVYVSCILYQCADLFFRISLKTKKYKPVDSLRKTPAQSVFLL